MWRNNQTRDDVLTAINLYPNLIIFDTETTGLRPENGDEIIELAARKFTVDEADGLVEEDRLHLYLKPSFAISEKITELTGITNDFLSDKPSADEVFDQIEAFFKDTVIAAYNTPFDRRFMQCMFDAHGKNFEPPMELDVLQMARDLVPKSASSSHKLGAIASLYGVDEGIQFHSAMDDVEATKRLFNIFIDEYKASFDRDCISDTTKLMKPVVIRVSYWEGYRGYSRIYVLTNCGTVFYDIRNQCWEAKDCSMDRLDMAYVENTALALVNATNLSEFSRFRGSLSA